MRAVGTTGVTAALSNVVSVSMTEDTEDDDDDDSNVDLAIILPTAFASALLVILLVVIVMVQLSRNARERYMRRQRSSKEVLFRERPSPYSSLARGRYPPPPPVYSYVADPFGPYDYAYPPRY